MADPAAIAEALGAEVRGEVVAGTDGYVWKCFECGDSSVKLPEVDASLELYRHRQRKHVRRRETEA